MQNNTALRAQEPRLASSQPRFEPNNVLAQQRYGFSRPDRPLKILLLGNYRPAVALARALRHEGHEVLCGQEGFEGGAEHSNTVSQIWDHPSLKDNPEAFFLELILFARTEKIDVVYPVTEAFVCAFAERYDDLAELFPWAIHNPNQIRACTDKLAMYDRAARLSIPTMLHARVKTSVQLKSTMKNIGTPLVVRPENAAARFDNKKVFTVASDTDLDWFLKHWEPAETSLVCQRFASGNRHNVYFAAEKGQIFRYLEAKILRTDIADGSGLATEGITVVPDPKLRRYTELMLADLNYTGIGCAQYLVDDATGEVSFLEINTRIAGNHAVPEAAGLGLTEIPIALAFSEPLNFVRKEGRSGLRYVWTSGAFMGAKVGWIRGDLSALQAVGWVARATYKAIEADIHMVFSWRDPKPAVMSMLACLPSMKGIFKRLLPR